MPYIFLDEANPEYLKKCLADKQAATKKREALVIKIVNACLKKGLNVSIHSETKNISVFSGDFKFNYDSYFSEELENIKTSHVVPLKELHEMVKSYKINQ